MNTGVTRTALSSLSGNPSASLGGTSKILRQTPGIRPLKTKKVNSITGVARTNKALVVYDSLMELLRAINTTFTFEVAQSAPPPLGTQFRDNQDHIWTVRDTRQGVIALHGPDYPAGPYWNVTLEAQHPAYKVEPWSTLTRVWQNHEITAAREVLLTRFADKEGFDAVGVEPTSDGLIMYVSTDDAEAQVPAEVNGLRVRAKRQ